MTIGALRRALLVQGLCLSAPVVGLLVAAVASTINPPRCYGWCLNLTPLFYGSTAVVFVPPLAVILLLAWRWRGPRLWPAAALIVTDLVIVILAAGVLQAYATQWPSPVAEMGLVPLIVILPALATGILAIDVLRPIPWRPVIAASAAACIALAALVAADIIGPIHQDIPGQLSLPFKANVVYTQRDLGCSDTDRGWTHQHNCYDAALVVYKGTGNPNADMLTIDRVVEDRTRYSPTQDQVEPLPVDRPFGQTYLTRFDPRQAGGCLLIIDRVSTAPSEVGFDRCGTPGDYADIRAHWPGDDSYAIGIIYRYMRPG